MSRNAKINLALAFVLIAFISQTVVAFYPSLPLLFLMVFSYGTIIYLDHNIDGGCCNG